MSQAIVPLPYMLQFPRFYSGEITLGAMTQSASAFGQIQDGLSFFRHVYDTSPATGPRSSGSRVWSPPTKKAGRCRRSRPCPVSTARSSSTTSRSARPTESNSSSPLDMRLEVGDTLVVTGAVGSGKTTLLRSLAELWPFTSGTLTRPCGPNETMFLSQLPYVPLGDLRAVVSYPMRRRHDRRRNAEAHAGERWPCHISSPGSTRCRTGPRCSPPANNSGSRSPACC